MDPSGSSSALWGCRSSSGALSCAMSLLSHSSGESPAFPVCPPGCGRCRKHCLPAWAAFGEGKGPVSAAAALARPCLLCKALLEREEKKALFQAGSHRACSGRCLFPLLPGMMSLWPAEFLCFPKSGQTALVLSQAPQAAFCKMQAVHNWFHKEFLFSLLIKVLQRESEVFVFHDS